MSFSANRVLLSVFGVICVVVALIISEHYYLSLDVNTINYNGMGQIPVNNITDHQEDIMNALPNTTSPSEYMDMAHSASYFVSDEDKSRFVYWMKGIGNETLSNKGFDDDLASYCRFPPSNGRTPLPLYKYTNKFVQHYEKLKTCESNIFSTLYGRTIVIKNLSFTKCEHLQSASVFDYLYWRSPEFRRHERDFETIHNVDNVDASDIVLFLNDDTQITFIRCSPWNNSYNYIRNVHYSILPLHAHRPSSYLTQKEIHSSLTSDSAFVLPNVLILIIDSTSRANFMRTTPILQSFLNDILYENGSPSYLYQFFRHSTTGSDTWANLKGLFKGITDNNDMKTPLEQRMSLAQTNAKYMDMYEFFHQLGYVIPEYHRIGEYDHANVWLQGFNKQMNTHFLCQQLHWRGCNFGRYPKQWLEIIEKWLLNRDIDGLPYFINVNLEDNHVNAGVEMLDIDDSLRDFLKRIDLANTVVWFLGDHGNKMGALNYATRYPNILEANNPFSFLFFPKKSAQYILNFDAIHRNILQNQQKLITHWDLNYFFKQLPLLFIENQSMIRYVEDIIENSSFHAHVKKGLKSIMFDSINHNRTCKDIGFNAGSAQFCLCAKRYIIDSNETYNKDSFLAIAIEYINNRIGNGLWDCEKLKVFNFEICGNIVASQSLYSQQHKIYEFDIKHVDDKNNLEYFVSMSKGNVIKVERVDLFKYESCIIDPETEVTKDHEIWKAFIAKHNWEYQPIFKNQMLMDRIARMRNETLETSRNINLRLCSCKTS
eukprot:235552_1